MKILDLGLSRFASMRDDDRDLTAAGQVLGTKLFMAPEQFQTNRVDSRADLYSLGASLWCLLSGEPPPFPETGVLSEKTAVRGDTIASRTLSARRDDVPQELAAILNTFTAHAPSDRPGTAGELAAMLQPYCEGSDLRALLMRAWDAMRDSTLSSESLEHRTPSSATQAAKIPRRLPWVVLLVALVAAGTLLTLAALNGKLFPGSTPAEQADNPALKDLAKKPPPGKLKPQTPLEQQQERDVAVWVLKQGGQVTRHPHGGIRRLEDIPNDGPFRIRRISLVNRGIADGDLKRFQPLSMLDSLVLKDNSRLTNDGLAELARMENLKWLYLGGTQITDAGLTHLNRLSRLESLGLEGTAVTDKGLAALALLKHLRELQLDKTGVTDDGLKHLRNFPGLARLDLSLTRVTDAGLKHLVKAAPQIRFLRLKLTRISDSGVAHLKELRHLNSTTPTQPSGQRHLIVFLREMPTAWYRRIVCLRCERRLCSRLF